ncbi:putative wall-associated receptor kinase, galacturonan-binding domain-containing protein [Helianthus annuus]|nr:putative wall-associated receptor kinase, galacturonan-binding domain-containing protein [Helianthus annuus]
MKKQYSTILLFFSFFFLFNYSFSLDPIFESCVPKDCGDGINISYPFFIHDIQDPNCGYPGFELHCNNRSTILQLPESNFTVKHIDYNISRIRIQSSMFTSNRTDHCLSSIRNITSDPNRFMIDNNTTTKLYSISSCSSNVSRVLEKYRNRLCENEEYVMVKDDMNFKNLTDGCGRGGKIVAMPVELGGGEVVDGGNYMEVVEKGFVMRWHAADCGVCERSGGRCGFNRTVFQFRCLCPDRPHMVSCKPGKIFQFLLYCMH